MPLDWVAWWAGATICLISVRSGLLPGEDDTLMFGKVFRYGSDHNKQDHRRAWEARGKNPCIRGLRITVWNVLGWLGAGMSEDQILDEHPDPLNDDISRSTVWVVAFPFSDHDTVPLAGSRWS